MANGRERLAQGLTAANQALGTGLSAIQAQKQQALQQKQTVLKQRFDQAKTGLDFGFKLLEQTKSKEGQQAIFNNFISPNIAITSPGVKPFNIEDFDDPTQTGIEIMANAFKLNGLQGLQQVLPDVLNFVASKSADASESTKIIQQQVESLQGLSTGISEEQRAQQGERRTQQQFQQEFGPGGFKERQATRDDMKTQISAGLLQLRKTNEGRQLLKDFEKTGEPGALSTFFSNIFGLEPGTEEKVQESRKGVFKQLTGTEIGQRPDQPQTQQLSTAPTAPSPTKLPFVKTEGDKKAVKALQDAGAPVTEANMKAAKKQLNLK